MKVTLLAGAALAGIFAGASASAAPADSGWYGAVDLGGHVQPTMVTTAEFRELTAGPATLQFNNDANFAGFARIGYKISPHFRVELEAGYRTNELNVLNERYFAG